MARWPSRLGRAGAGSVGLPTTLPPCCECRHRTAQLPRAPAAAIGPCLQHSTGQPRRARGTLTSFHRARASFRCSSEEEDEGDEAVFRPLCTARREFAGSSLEYICWDRTRKYVGWRREQPWGSLQRTTRNMFLEKKKGRPGEGLEGPGGLKMARGEPP